MVEVEVGRGRRRGVDGEPLAHRGSTRPRPRPPATSQWRGAPAATPPRSRRCPTGTAAAGSRRRRACAAHRSDSVRRSITSSQVMSAHARAARPRPSPRSRAGGQRPQARRWRRRSPPASGSATRPVSPSVTNSSGPPASVGGDHRLAREEGLHRDVAVVLVERRVVGGAAARVQVDERRRRPRSRAAPRGPRRPRPTICLRSSSRQRARARDLEPRPAAHALHGVDGEVEALQAVEPAGVEEVVAVGPSSR